MKKREKYGLTFKNAYLAIYLFGEQAYIPMLAHGNSALPVV